jgi:hypothetical protein
MRQRADFFLLAPNRGGLLRLSEPRPESGQVLYFRLPHEFDGLVKFLRAATIRRVHFHQTVRLHDAILRLPEIFGLPYDYTVHDYYSFCPQITLTTESFVYCGEPNEAGCNCRHGLPRRTNRLNIGGRDIRLSWRPRIGFSLLRRMSNAEFAAIFRKHG